MKDPNLKPQIENLYTNAVYNDEAPSVFASKVLETLGEDDERPVRTSDQRKAKWKYLTMVANVLNDKGYGFKAHGIDIEVRYTKDLLDSVYWQNIRETLYPKTGKRLKPLNTKEYCNVADHAQDLFAMVFDVHIPFPNMKDFLAQKEAEQELKQR